MKHFIKKKTPVVFLALFFVFAQLLALFPHPTHAVLDPTIPPEFVTKWGSAGAGDGQFNGHRGIALDSQGNVYVTELFNNRIQKFDQNGNLLVKWNGDDLFEPVQGYWSTSGPFGIAIDSEDNFYVNLMGLGDGMFVGVQKFNSEGNFLLSWGNDTGIIYGMAIDSHDNVYVAGDSGIKKYNKNGVLLAQWGSFGSGDGQFNNPVYVAVDSHDNIYVTDIGNHRVQKFDQNGNFLTKWGSPGIGNGQFDMSQSGVAVDANDNVYIVDDRNHRIQKFDSNGTFIMKWGSQGSADGQFSFPRNMAIDSTGKMFVLDPGNGRIQVFAYPPLVTEATLTNAANGAQVMLQTPAGTSEITCNDSFAEDGQVAQDETYKYPLGFVGFCFDTLEEENEVSLTFVTDMTPDQVVARKYNFLTETYFTVPGAVITQTTYQSQPALQLTYTIEDNGLLDLDPEAGKIVDPVGLAVAEGDGGETTSGSGTAAAGTLAATGVNTTFLTLLALLTSVTGVLAGTWRASRYSG